MFSCFSASVLSSISAVASLVVLDPVCALFERTGLNPPNDFSSSARLSSCIALSLSAAIVILLCRCAAAAAAADCLAFLCAPAAFALALESDNLDNRALVALFRSVSSPWPHKHKGSCASLPLSLSRQRHPSFSSPSSPSSSRSPPSSRPPSSLANDDQRLSKRISPSTHPTVSQRRTSTGW